MENSKDVRFTKGYWRKNAKSNQLEAAYMLSELVDNSLSSWLVNKDDNADGCYVEIAYVVYKDENGNEAEKIVVSDNAFGVEQDQIEKILTPGADNEKETKLNVYGFGLKDAAFWSGLTLAFKTRTLNNDFATLSEISLKGAGDERPQIVTKVLSGKDANIVYYKDDEAVYENHGTQVTLSDLYKLRKFEKLGEMIKLLKNSGMDDKSLRKSNDITFSLLAYKYRRYLEDGMKINFVYCNKINTSDSASYEFNAERIDEYVRNTFLKERPSEHLHRVLLQVNANKKAGTPDFTWEEAVRDVTNNAKDPTGKIDVSAFKNDYISILNSDNDPVEEEYTIDVDTVQGLKVTFGYLASSESRWRGLYLYQYKRAICTGPNKTGEDYNSTFDIFSNSETVRDNHLFLRRLWGEMDIDRLIDDRDTLVLNTNKRGINKDESEKYDQFVKAIKAKATVFASKWAPLIDEIEQWGIHNGSHKEGMSTSAEEQNTTLKTIVQYSKDAIKEVGTLDNENNFSENNDINTIKITEKPLLKFVFSGIEGGEDSILFMIKEIHGDVEDYPFSYTPMSTKSGLKYYQISMNTDSNLLKPLWEKGSLKQDRQDFVKTKIVEVYYKLAIVETVYSIFEQYKDEDIAPAWVLKLKSAGEDATDDYTKKIKDSISAMLAGASIDE